jgi:hypothetical protein
LRTRWQEFAHLFWDELLRVVQRRHFPAVVLQRKSRLALDNSPAEPVAVSERQVFAVPYEMFGALEASSSDTADSPERKRSRHMERPQHVSQNELRHLTVHKSS